MNRNLQKLFPCLDIVIIGGIIAIHKDNHKTIVHKLVDMSFPLVLSCIDSFVESYILLNGININPNDSWQLRAYQLSINNPFRFTSREYSHM